MAGVWRLGWWGEKRVLEIIQIAFVRLQGRFWLRRYWGQNKRHRWNEQAFEAWKIKQQIPKPEISLHTLVKHDLWPIISGPGLRSPGLLVTLWGHPLFTVGNAFAISIKMPEITTLYQLTLESHTHKMVCQIIQHGIVCKTKNRKEPMCSTNRICYMNHGTSIQFTITQQRKKKEWRRSYRLI